jgi:hypothetical protein
MVEAAGVELASEKVYRERLRAFRFGGFRPPRAEPARASLARLKSSLLDGVSPGEHPLVQDAIGQNALGTGPVEDDMPAVLHAAQAATNIIADSTCHRVVGKHLATRSEIGNVADGLICAPGLEGVSTDADQVGFSATGETKPGHNLAPSLRKL